MVRRVEVSIWLVAILSLLLLVIPIVSAGRHDSDTEQEHLTEESVTAGLDQSILDSAAAEIQAQLDLENDLNSRSAGETRKIVDAHSAEAATLDLEQHPRSAPTEATTLSFIAEMEEPVGQLEGVDVESHLDTIATELDTLFKTDAQIAAEKQAKAAAEARANSRAGRAEARRMKAQQAKQAREQARKEAAAKHRQKQQEKQAAAKVAAQQPSRRQQKLVARLDGYRTARGHADISTLEATAQAKATVQNGYSVPSVLVPAGAVGAIPPGPAPAAYQGQVGYNPLLSAGWLGVPPQAVQAPIAAPAASIGGVGALLQALKSLQEQQETASLLSKLSALLRPAAPAPVVPQVIASPFNYGQSLLATPQGYINPNLLPPQQQLLTPRVLPGAVPGWSPALPSYIPNEQANVGVEAEQPNPFEAHSP